MRSYGYLLQLEGVPILSLYRRNQFLSAKVASWRVGDADGRHTEELGRGRSSMLSQINVQTCR